MHMTVHQGVFPPDTRLQNCQTKPQRHKAIRGYLGEPNGVFTCQSSAQPSQLVFGQVKLGCHTESLLPTATSHKGTESFLVGTTAGEHEPCWLTQVLLQQVFPVSNADVLGQEETKGW